MIKLAINIFGRYLITLKSCMDFNLCQVTEFARICANRVASAEPNMPRGGINSKSNIILAINPNKRYIMKLFFESYANTAFATKFPQNTTGRVKSKTIKVDVTCAQRRAAALATAFSVPLIIVS